MPWTPTTVGIREASLISLQQMMIAKISDLQAALAGIAPAIPFAAPISAGQFYIGDFDTLPPQSGNSFWVTVEGGGKQNAVGAEFSQLATGGVKRRIYYTNIYWYLSRSLFASGLGSSGPVNSFTQAQARTLLRARIEDWLIDDVFNTRTASVITLGSQTFSPPANDQLKECLVTQVTESWVQKAYGDSDWLWYLHLMHKGVAEGPT